MCYSRCFPYFTRSIWPKCIKNHKNHSQNHWETRTIKDKGREGGKLNWCVCVTWLNMPKNRIDPVYIVLLFAGNCLPLSREIYTFPGSFVSKSMFVFYQVSLQINVMPQTLEFYISAWTDIRDKWLTLLTVQGWYKLQKSSKDAIESL